VATHPARLVLPDSEAVLTELPSQLWLHLLRQFIGQWIEMLVKIRIMPASELPKSAGK